MGSTKIQSIIILSASVLALAGCGSGGGSGAKKSNSSPASQTNADRTYPHWVPYLTEHYDTEGGITSCIRGNLDSDGYLLSATTSSPATDQNQPVQCSDDDQNTTFAEFTYNADRTEFSTMTQSTFAPYVDCQNVFISSEGMPNRIETYVSGSGNFTCSIQDGTLFSLQLITLESDLYETLTVSYAGSGPDNLWETEDDTIQARYVSTWSPDYLIKNTISYLGAGDDGVWGNEDDFISGAVETVFKEDMIPDHSVSTSPGLDGALDTQDDFITGYTVFTYENGEIKKHTSYGSAGADGIWETVEDNFKQYTVFY